MRWHPEPEWTAGMQAAQLAEWNSATWLQVCTLFTTQRPSITLMGHHPQPRGLHMHCLLPPAGAAAIAMCIQRRVHTPFTPVIPRLQMAVVPAALNVGWAVAYFLLIFVFFNKRIQERGYQNM